MLQIADSVSMGAVRQTELYEIENDFFGLFWCWSSVLKKIQEKKHQKETNCTKMRQTKVFRGWLGFCQDGFLKRIDTICVWKCGNKEHLCEHDLLWQHHLFSFFEKKNRKHYKHLGFSKQRAKPNLFFKKLFLEGVSERLFSIGDSQKLCSAETIFYCGFNKHSFCRN